MAIARCFTWRTRPQLVQVSISASRPRPHIGQVTASGLVVLLAANDPGAVDQGVATAVRQARRKDRQAVLPEFGDARAVLELESTRGLRTR